MAVHRYPRAKLIYCERCLVHTPSVRSFLDTAAAQFEPDRLVRQMVDNTSPILALLDAEGRRREVHSISSWELHDIVAFLNEHLAESDE
mmetsp:Transcript_14286/g.43020  ORF Transcript_14286/g.43020 Transcript_14286/m.43020 type:complete len:89 (-) Transcript_14286:90-356(-)|eukprot:CAMPEP_0177649096 /NCGR_PEP_ID=MMETSP0447-20121125/11185_1 /TAXON_ID=0 /ORGANISM="Stygamoeba regulata, Strain BSH-02190019" /LENGTH=88 /DNA_ID=CAMNT_0019151793 /DNA_START=352 /DNA_END=618 /DNA_ORIENTATION=+